MTKKNIKSCVLILLVLAVSIAVRPFKVSGEVKPITEANEKLQDISEQEKETLEKLFLITQEIEGLEKEEARIENEIDELGLEIEKIDLSIKEEEENYDNYLGLFEQVLKSYQRWGPASYIDIILKAEDLTSLIKSLNLIKDISRNTEELLFSIEESRQKLEQKKKELADSLVLLEEKNEELKDSIAAKQRLVKELEDFLNSLAEEKERYEEHLNNLKIMWDNLKGLFSIIVDEFSRIINEGNFTVEDLNLKFSLFGMKGSIHQDTINSILNEHSNLSKMIFTFENDTVRIEIPENHLILDGYFVIRSNTALEFVPESGFFYNMALEKGSIDELFKNGPMIFDFEKIEGDMINLDIELKEISTEGGYLNFTISSGFMF
ncbi:MAG TPA: hypothetical protein PK304_03065 [Mobilitalea sp.]|nr:hypothetical protein [Mobilitalea sp.]